MHITLEEQRAFEAGLKKYINQSGDLRIVNALKRLAKLNEAVEALHDTPIKHTDVVGERYLIPCMRSGKSSFRRISLEELLVREYRKVAKYIPKILTKNDYVVAKYFEDLGVAIDACLRSDLDMLDDEEYIEEESDYVDYSEDEIDDINPMNPFELHDRLLMFKLLCGVKTDLDLINSKTIDELYEKMHTKVVCNDITHDLKVFVKTKK